MMVVGLDSREILRASSRVIVMRGALFREIFIV